MLALVPTVNHTGRAGLPEFASSSLRKFVGTHHLSSNHAIEIAGDVANTRSYLIAAHMLDPDDPSRHADVAGWYRCELRRTSDGWRFTYVTLDIRYASGEPLRLRGTSSVTRGPVTSDLLSALLDSRA